MKFSITLISTVLVNFSIGADNAVIKNNVGQPCTLNDQYETSDCSQDESCAYIDVTNLREEKEGKITFEQHEVLRRNFKTHTNEEWSTALALRSRENADGTPKRICVLKSSCNKEIAFGSYINCIICDKDDMNCYTRRDYNI